MRLILKGLHPEAQGREPGERTLGKRHANQVFYPERVASRWRAADGVQPRWGRMDYWMGCVTQGALAKPRDPELRDVAPPENDRRIGLVQGTIR